MCISKNGSKYRPIFYSKGIVINLSIYDIARFELVFQISIQSLYFLEL